MNFLVQLAWAVFFAVAARVFTPSPKSENATAATLQEIDTPSISEGMTVPVIFGTVKCDGQNVSWFGGLNSYPIVRQGGVVTGYYYHLTVQLTFCMGRIDGIKEIRFDDLVTPYTVVETADYYDLSINQPDLFGGVDKEGGVGGELRIYKGTTTQVADIEINTLVGAQTPAYRRVSYGVARNFSWGTSPRLKPFAPVLQRWPNGLGVSGGRHKIGEDANPVCVLYECLSDTVWGAGERTELFDLASWLIAADTVHSEGLGVSLRLATPGEVQSTIDDILRYIDATIFEDPETGVYTITLMRDDAAEPVILDADSLLDVNLSRVSWAELRNTIKVTYTDRERNYEQGAVQGQNSATLATVGNAASTESVDLPAFHSPAPAALAAARILRSVSYPLAKLQASGAAPRLRRMRPGMRFRLQWTRPTVDAVFRVTKVEFDTLGDPGTKLEAIEDVFSTSTNSFPAPSTSTWSNAGSAALPATETVAFEQPYHWTRVDTRSLVFGVAAPTASHVTYKLVLGGSYADSTPYPFASLGRLGTALAQWTGSATVDLTVAMTLPAFVTSPTATQYDAGQALLLLDGELLAYRTIVRNPDGTVTFGQCVRGALDTVPAAHAVGAQCWVLGSIYTRPDLAMTADADVALGALTATLVDAQQPGEEAVTTVTTTSRALRPIPPGAFLIDGLSYPAQVDNEPTLTWATRTRAATQVIPQDAGDQGAEAATTYTVTVTGDSTHSATVAGTSYTLPGSVIGNVRVQVASVRDGVASHQAQFCELSIRRPALLLETGGYFLLETGDRLLLE